MVQPHQEEDSLQTPLLLRHYPGKKEGIWERKIEERANCSEREFEMDCSKEIATTLKEAF